LQRLKEVTHYISHGDFSKKIEVERGDEIGDLSNSFNIMCDRLQELDRLKSDFISNITHDLKTPIASITEANQLVLDGASGSVSEQQQYLLNIIKEDSARLLRLIETIIDLSKMESGLLNYDLNPVEISHSVIEAIEAVKLLAKSKNILLSYGADKKLPRLLIDSEKMIQALINIFSNAIKFTPPGGKVSVEIRETKESAAQGGRGNDAGLEEAVKISISDTGPGIGQEDLPRIFEKFYRGHAAAATNGDGLGLTIVQHIIQAHGGRIWVDSQPGSGSKFNLFLPVRLMNL
jgi:two-component system sensor histidine kinase GlrK